MLSLSSAALSRSAPLLSYGSSLAVEVAYDRCWCMNTGSKRAWGR
jgi:hypothetical protein